MTVLNEMEQRESLAQSTADATEIDKFLAEKPRTVYAGFDPTADSLHVGNLVPIVGLKRFQQAGHRPIVVMGGATGMIGDPSGKSSERNLLSVEKIEENLAGQKKEFEKLIDFDCGENSAMLVNNYDWMKNWTLLDFMRDVGKNFRIGEMLSKDSVRSRLDGEGMSFTEFSYQILQGYDFLWLFENHDCVMQIGGSDQWGNIVSGTELIRRKHGSEAVTYAATLPLITTSSGEKFGKSAGNAVWLNPEKTSPYQFYQYFIRTDDRDVGRYLNYFTFIPVDEIKSIMEAHAQQPEKREAQTRLAKEMTLWVHGEEGLQKAKQASEVLFGGDIAGMSDSELKDIFADVPSSTVTSAQLEEGIPLINLVVDTGLIKSKKQARTMLESGGLYLNNQRVEDRKAMVTKASLASECTMILRSGKKNYHLVKIEN